MINLNQRFVGLIIKFRDACIYTWVNLNLSNMSFLDLIFSFN